MDSSPGDMCVVAATKKFTGTAEVLWRKRDGRATLSERDKAQTSAWTGFCCFSGHITWRMVLIHYAQVALGGYLLQTTKERKLLTTTEKKDICKCKGKSGRTGYTLSLRGLAYILGSYFKDMQ